MVCHHTIPKHEWKSRFGNLQGFNATDNLVNLTTEQHSQVHTHYFNEITHLELDRIAGLAISGMIGKEEARKIAAALANSTRKHSEKSKRKHSVFMTGNKNALGSTRTEEWKEEQSIRKKGLLIGYKHPKEFGEAISARMVGCKFSDARKKAMSDQRKGKKVGPAIRITCLYCGVIGGNNVMLRWHFEKCKKKPS
jgi:hypothetical protein